ncbi:MAG: cation transporter [Lentisphaerae bacterium]|nr:cation transporter [Lentisphaerota bacterium]
MHEHHHDEEAVPVRRMKLAIALTAVILVLEVIGGFYTHSLALLADAGHVLMDVFSLFLSLGALMIARQPSTATHTFGWHRAEILAALINGMLLLGVSSEILHEAILRLFAPHPILAGPMLVIAVIGMAVNGIVALGLHSHGRDDLNLRSAYLHVLSDMLASAAVVAGGIVILLTGWLPIDALLGVLITVLILVGAFRVLREAVHVLLEGTPRHLKADTVAEAIRAHPGVKDVHDLHIWTVCSHIVALSCHVELQDTDRDRWNPIVVGLQKMLSQRFCISHSTIQVDCEGCSGDLIAQDLWHGHAHHGHDHDSHDHDGHDHE